MTERIFDKSASRLMLVGAFASVYLIWGSTYLAIRFAIETMPPFLMIGVRFLVGGLCRRHRFDCPNFLSQK